MFDHNTIIYIACVNKALFSNSFYFVNVNNGINVDITNHIIDFTFGIIIRYINGYVTVDIFFSEDFRAYIDRIAETLRTFHH